MKRALVVGFARMLALLAVVFVSTASAAYFHRPEIPEELKR